MCRIHNMLSISLLALLIPLNNIYTHPQVTDGNLSADVLTQLGNNPALQRQINPLKGVKPLDPLTGEESDGSITGVGTNHVPSTRRGKEGEFFKTISSVCTVL